MNSIPEVVAHINLNRFNSVGYGVAQSCAVLDFNLEAGSGESLVGVSDLVLLPHF